MTAVGDVDRVVGACRDYLDGVGVPADQVAVAATAPVVVHLADQLADAKQLLRRVFTETLYARIDAFLEDGKK